MNDVIDCIKIGGINRLQCWSRAEIIEINEKKLKIAFLNEKSQLDRF